MHSFKVSKCHFKYANSQTCSAFVTKHCCSTATEVSRGIQLDANDFKLGQAVLKKGKTQIILSFSTCHSEPTENPKYIQKHSTTQHLYKQTQSIFCNCISSSGLWENGAYPSRHWARGGIPNNHYIQYTYLWKIYLHLVIHTERRLFSQ